MFPREANRFGTEELGVEPVVVLVVVLVEVLLEVAVGGAVNRLKKGLHFLFLCILGRLPVVAGYFPAIPIHIGCHGEPLRSSITFN